VKGVAVWLSFPADYDAGDHGPLVERALATEPQMRELDRRLALLESGGTTESTWEEVEARILGRLRG